MRYSKRFLMVAAVLAALGVSGCEETDRPLTYEKGVYGGQPDESLSPEQIDTLRERTRMQQS